MITVMILTLAVCLFIGMPIAFAVASSSMIFIYLQGFPTLSVIPQKMVEGVNSFPFLALPLFILSGEIMMYGSTPRLMRLANMLVRKVPGGLGAATSIGCAFFGAVSGSGVASTAAVGNIVEPEMIKRGYSKAFTASLVAGAGNLGMIIPPSFTMVMYGATGGVSIGAMFVAGVLPGLLMSLAFVLLSIFIGKIRGYKDSEFASLTLKDRLFIVSDALLPLVMPLIILGGVMSGAVTPTESAAVASIYAFFLAGFVYKEINLSTIIKICSNSTLTTAIVMLVIATSASFSWLSAMNGIPEMFTKAMISLSDDPVTIVVLVTILMVILGTFMDANCLIILLTPILVPLMITIGFDTVHFGIILICSMAIGGVTPPLALSLFVSTRIAKIGVDQTFPDCLYVVGVMFVVTMILIFFPDISLYLPSLAGLVN